MVNYVLYQAGWFACVLGAAWHYPLVGLSLAMLLIAIHLLLVREIAVEGPLLVLALCVGLLVEWVQFAGGTYRFTSGVIVDGWPPPWLLALWAQLATTFRFSLRHVFARPLLALLFGAAGGPLAFLAGERLGAVILLPPVAAGLVRLSICWTVAMAIFAYVLRRIGRPAAERERRDWPAISES